MLLLSFLSCHTGKAIIDVSETTVECLSEGNLSLEGEISWFYWGGSEAPEQLFSPEVISSPCEEFVADSSVDWLIIEMEEDGASLKISLDPTQVVSGKHQANISIWDSQYQNILADIPISLAALVSPSDGDIQKRALVIGVDGADGDEMHTATLPNLELLQEGGVWTRNARTQITGATYSGPGWTSILTGVEVEDHQVTSNGNYDSRNTNYPSFLYKLRQEGMQSSASIQWPDISLILEDDAVEEDGLYISDQQGVTDWMVARIQEANDQVMFVHLDDVDHAGHATSFTIDSNEYIEALEKSDRNIGELLEAILSGPNIAQEEWLIILTSDHGGDTEGTHGTMSEDYRQIPLIVAGPSVVKSQIPDGFGNHMDPHPTVLDFFGYNPEFEGVDGISWLQEHELDCSDGLDNDQDGMIDCEDPTCQSSLECIECDPVDLGSEMGRSVAENLNPSVNLITGSCGGESGFEEIFTWIAPADGTYVMDTMDWYRDTVLYVLDGDCSGSELACNESPSTSQRSVLSVTAQEGDELLIVIDTDGSDTTTTGLSIYPESDSCTAALQATDSWTEEFTHIDSSYAGSCVPMISPIWWEWSAPSDGLYTINTYDSNFDTVLYVLDSCNGAELSCNDDYTDLHAGTQVSLLEGDMIIIGVGSFAGRATNETIHVSITN